MSDTSPTSPGDDSGAAAGLQHNPVVATERPDLLIHSRGPVAAFAVLYEAGLRLWNDEAMALAGNIAFRLILSIFPFLIFVSTLTAFIGDPQMAEQLINFLLRIVPPEIAGPLVNEVRNVLTVQRTGTLGISVLLTIWFAMGGVDSVRVGLNRAYGHTETRSAVFLFILQAFLVVGGALILVMVGFLLIVAPIGINVLHNYAPDFAPTLNIIDALRYPVAALLLIGALFAAHVLLPTRRTRFSNTWPGIMLTLVVWLLFAGAFSWYLSNFANYASYYAGLAGVMAALIFLYLSALVMIFGGEVNRAMRIRRLARTVSRHTSSGGPDQTQTTHQSPG